MMEELFMKKARKMAAFVSAAVMTLSMASASFAVCAEDDNNILNDYEQTYQPIDTEDSYHYEKYPFKELLEMSDEDFIKLDTFHGEIKNPDNFILGTFSLYRCIYQMLLGSEIRLSNKPYSEDFPHIEKKKWDIGTEKEYYVYNGSSEEDFKEFKQALEEAGFFSLADDEIKNIRAIIPTDIHEDNPEGKHYFYLAVGSLRSRFYLPDYDEEYKNFDRDSFESDMNEVFGDTVKYKIEEYGGVFGKTKNLFVTFDIPEITEINQDNVLYSAKLYYALTSISPYFTYKDTYTFGNKEDTTTTTTPASTTAPLTTSIDTMTSTDDLKNTTTISESSTSKAESTTTTVSTTKAKTTNKENKTNSPKTGNNGISGAILAGIGAAAAAFALRKREE